MAFETIDDRRRRTEIAQRKLTLVAATAVKLAAETININGELLNYVINAPTLTTDTDFDFVITNADSETIYENTGIADIVSTTVLLSAAPVPMSGELTFTCSYATDQTSSFDVYLYYK